MIGKHTIKLDAENFIRGMSSSDHIADGGFSSKTNRVNLIATKGVLHSPATVTDKSANLAGQIIADAGDANVLGNYKYFVTNTGKFFTWNGSVLTLRQTDSSGSYVLGTVSMAQYKLQLFCTFDDDIAMLSGSDLATLDATWWTITKSKSALQLSQRHPLLVYEDTLFIGDKSNIHSWNGTTASSNVLVLSSEQAIVSLGIEPGTGYMLIGTTEGTNASNSYPQIAKVLVWDGFSNKPLRSIIVDDAVNAFYSVGGVTFVTYGTKLGYWNGSGITYLRTFENVTRSSSLLIYPAKITNIGETLYIADGKRILAYGDIVAGRKVFYPAYYAGIDIDLVANIGEGKLGIAYPTAKFDTLDVESVATITGVDFYSNKFNFPRPVIIRSAFVEYANGVSANVTPIRLYIYDEKQNSTEFSSFKNTTGVVEYHRTSLSIDLKVRTCQIYCLLQNANPGIRRIVISYDVI